jgi:RNA polymerase sigma-70 factor (ECF subfamily)
MVDPDTQLMVDFCAGDLAAFKRLVERNHRIVFSLACRYLGQPAEAEDALQDVFMRIYEAAGRYKPTAKFTTWVYRITVNVCLNRLRANRSRRGVPLEGSADGEDVTRDIAADVSETPLARFEREELEAKVREAMERLPETQRTAVLLRRFDELSYAEIAEVMGTTIPAVKSLLARARASLKSFLSKYL